MQFPKNVNILFTKNAIIAYFVGIIKMVIYLFNSNIENNITVLDKLTRANESFDIVKRIIRINKKKTALYFIDGLLKDDIMEKLMEFFYDISDDSFLKDADSFMENCIPYVEVTKSRNTSEIVTSLLSGIALMTIDGIEDIILIDTRTYPQRETAEPVNDKVLRGSRDAFTEIFIHNCVLVRRRIRDKNLTISAMQAGKSSKTDIALVYMNDRVDKQLLEKIKKNSNRPKWGNCFLKGQTLYREYSS